MNESRWMGKVPLVGTDGELLGTSSLAEAQILEALLTANGIDCELSQPSRGLDQMPAHLVLVASEQADQSARVIAEAQQAGAAAADEAELAGEIAGDHLPDGPDSGASGLL